MRRASGPKSCPHLADHPVVRHVKKMAEAPAVLFEVAADREVLEDLGSRDERVSANDAIVERLRFGNESPVFSMILRRSVGSALRGEPSWILTRLKGQSTGKFSLAVETICETEARDER